MNEETFTVVSLVVLFGVVLFAPEFVGVLLWAVVITCAVAIPILEKRERRHK